MALHWIERIMNPDRKNGVLLALGAYGIWGIAPLYFKAVSEVPSLELVGHRIVWSVVFLLGFLALRGRLWSVVALLRSWKTSGALFLTASLISGNWLLFIHSVVSGQVLEASLGYFINPVLTIALSVVFLKERLSRRQLMSLCLVILGIVVQLVQIGKLPWIALVLASTFAMYGLIRKKIGVPSLQGLLIETIFVLPAALGYLGFLATEGRMKFLTGGPALEGMLIAAGIITSVPLLLFVAAANRVPYSWMGFMQYITPSLHFSLAIFVFGEYLDPARLLSFGFVWGGLALLLWGSRGRTGRQIRHT